MSDTPRTDDAVAKFIKRTYTGACECVDAEDMRQLERENEALRKDVGLLTYWAENAMGEFLYDATNHDFLKFIPKKAPRSAELVRAALSAAIKEQSHD